MKGSRFFFLIASLTLGLILSFSMADSAEAKTHKKQISKTHSAKKTVKKKSRQAKVQNEDLSIDELNQEITQSSAAKPVTEETHDKKDFNLATDGYGGYIQ
ncbi:MAG: hypothetical protein ACAH59_11160 [Pseudobdellovibrionaceae bacterium]